MANSVLIRHPKTGEEYQVLLADYRRKKAHRDPKTGELETYAEAGFEVVSYADGSPYEPPAPPAPREEKAPS